MSGSVWLKGLVGHVGVVLTAASVTSGCFIYDETLFGAGAAAGGGELTGGVASMAGMSGLGGGSSPAPLETGGGASGQGGAAIEEMHTGAVKCRLETPFPSVASFGRLDSFDMDWPRTSDGTGPFFGQVGQWSLSSDVEAYSPRKLTQFEWEEGQGHTLRDCNPEGDRSFHAHSLVANWISMEVQFAEPLNLSAYEGVAFYARSAAKTEIRVNLLDAGSSLELSLGNAGTDWALFQVPFALDSEFDAFNARAIKILARPVYDGQPIDLQLEELGVYVE